MMHENRLSKTNFLKKFTKEIYTSNMKKVITNFDLKTSFICLVFFLQNVTISTVYKTNLEKFPFLGLEIKNLFCVANYAELALLVVVINHFS